ncbi:MAG TPA: aminotransferase class V-fold PLP-dependent enzyme [Dehalococcoidia bacterium]|nr:aminotransferase class V-fold PLP-dependent enzyme [Dehalococcoidia bacterium]
MIYLDNAATSWPKPPEVLKAMVDVLQHAGGNPGRSGHRLSIEAARVIYNAREDIARFFNIGDPSRVIFTSNATHAINLVLQGLLKPGDRVVTSSIEHNAVMRPLRSLEKQGLILHTVPCAPDGMLDMRSIAAAIDSHTRLVVLIHASNVMGTMLPVAEVAHLAHHAGALLLVDAAQTAGAVPIDMKAGRIDFLAFTGHKGLQGPPGIGGLVIGDHVDTSQVEPLMRGGTGSQSELELQPESLPDKFESGTPNIAGIAGLHAGIRWLMDRGIHIIREHELELTRNLINGLSSMPGIKVYGTSDLERRTAIISFTANNKEVSEIGLKLDDDYGILVRVGLHCAPAAHRTIGTFPGGTVRLAPGAFTTMDDVNKTIWAIEQIIAS